MLKRIPVVVMLWLGICGMVSAASGPYCPGSNASAANNYIPTNLACEVADAAVLGNPGAGYTAAVPGFPSAVGSQIEQLPLATTVSGTGLVFNKDLGVFTASGGSLGTILTQRGETLGKHKFLLGFTYQHFRFDTLDGINLNHFQSVSAYSPTGGSATEATQSKLDIGLAIDEYAALASFGLTDRIDLNLIVPFSRVSLDTTGVDTEYPLLVTTKISTPGVAGGIGDVRLTLKANVVKAQNTFAALGAEVRFPSGDAANFLGSGAYGVKPYFVLSHSGRFTPNLNLAYQWNGNSILDVPSSFLYSGGVEFRVTPKFTLVSEFLGQCVINGFRIRRAPAPEPFESLQSINTYKATYAMDNVGGGFKWSPVKRLIINGSVLFKVDNAGLRALVVPLAGAQYTF